MALLLRITSAQMLVELRGPTETRWGALNVEGTEPHMELVSTDACVAAEVSSPDGESIAKWIPGGPGPRLFEAISYQLFVRSNTSHSPRVIHRDPRITRDIVIHEDDGICTGSVNFGSQVGRTDLRFVVGHHEVSVKLEIFPTKLDYATDYREILSDVSRLTRALTMAFLRATYRGADTRAEDATTNLEWITLLRSELKRLEQAMHFINAHPQRALRRERQVQRLDRLTRVDSSVRRRLTRPSGHGPWVQLAGLPQPVPEVIEAPRSRDTLDTSEHRWLRQRLTWMQARVSELRGSVADEMKEGSRRGAHQQHRLAAEHAELGSFAEALGRLTSLPVFDEIHEPPAASFTSLTLTAGIGYGEAYRSILLLSMGLAGGEGSVEASLKALHELFEIWCYLTLVKTSSKYLEADMDFATVIRVDEAGIRVRLRKGATSAVVGRGKNGLTISIEYNPQFPGPTGLNQPDIVVRFLYPEWPELILVFDAKYRVDTSDRYLAAFNSPGPPSDAIGSLHRYRDAILLDGHQPALGRPVVKGVALFPLNVEQSKGFEDSELFKALTSLGIGALPLLPSNVELFESWFTSQVNLDVAELASPGPPFLGWEERRRREVIAKST